MAPALLRQRAVVSVIVLVALIVGGCTSSGNAKSTRSASPSSADVAIARPSCLGSNEGILSVVRDPAGNESNFLLLGSGGRGVLLVPQSDGDICQWLSMGRQLALAGYRVGVMDWGLSRDDSVRAATRALRGAGATSVVLVGASLGGAYVLGLAASLRPDGVASLSGEAALPDWDTVGRLRSYTGPLLLIGSRTDGYCPAACTHELAASHPGPEQVLIVAGAAHGVELLEGAAGGLVLTRFLAFLKRVSAP